MAFQIEFKKSGKTIAWSDQFDSILELAQRNGIEIESDCEQGFCGTCMVKLLSGEVEMEVEDALDDTDREKGMILTCTAVPTSDIVLEA